MSLGELYPTPSLKTIKSWFGEQCHPMLIVRAFLPAGIPPV